MSDALPLPPRPNLEQYKRLAKDFQHACKSGDPGAIRQWAARWPDDAERLEHNWKEFKKREERATACRLADAQFFLARAHGFASWPKFAKHVEALARASTPVSKFEAAADAIVGGDLAALGKLLRANPELIKARSTREHRSTLLHYVSANGVEDFRQKTPPNIVEITKMLLDAGADVNAESDAYAGGSTTLGLTATSMHPEEAGVQIALLETLLDRGSWIDQPSAGKWRSVVRGCLANGQPEAAEFLASRGAPLDLEEAAGLGRLERVKECFPATKEQLGVGFLSACAYGRSEVVAFLLEKGVDPGLHDDIHRTGLHNAAFGAHADVIRLLLDRSARVDVKEERFHATPLDVALWVWHTSSDPEDRERCYEVVRLLKSAGAKLDPQQWSNADESEPDMLGKIRSDPRMLAALGEGLS